MDSKNLISRLENSVMFNLSLSSKELFHSNFLAFLFKKYPDLFGKIIGAIDFETITIFREHQNVDLKIFGKNTQKYFIENKVKDVLSQIQYDDVSSKDKDALFILFSLLGNNLSSIDNTHRWKEFGYSDIVGHLRNYDFKDNYTKYIVDDYCNFVEALVLLLGNELKNCNKYIFYYSNSTFEQLHSIRMHDVFLKYGMSLLKNSFEKQFKDTQVHFGINRGKGTIDFLKKDMPVYIQIEDSQYRKVAICDENTRNELENKGWFNNNWRSSRNKPYLSYAVNDKNKKFWYQLKEIDIKNMSFEELGQRIYQDLSSINWGFYGT